MSLWKKEYKSKYHLLLSDQVSSQAKNKVRLELGLYMEIQISELKSIEDRLDYYILTQNIDGIKICFTLFKKKWFLSRTAKQNLLKKFYPYIRSDVENYAKKNNFYFICSYFDSKYIQYNKTADYYFLLANSCKDINAKQRYINEYFSFQKLSLIYSKNLFCTRNFSSYSRKNRAVFYTVSVIMTCFNNELDIEASIKSVLNQYSVMVELIIIDDASCDASIQIIKNIASNDARVKPIFLTENIGTYCAKNIALNIASGKYLAFQDADDFSHPERLIRSILHLEKQKHLVAVSSRYVRLTDQGQFISSKKIPLIRWSPLTLVINREIVLSKLKQFEEVRLGGDSEFFARLIANFGMKSHYIIDKVLMICRDRHNSLMKEDTDFFGFSMQRNEYQNFYNERILYNLKQYNKNI